MKVFGTRQDVPFFQIFMHSEPEIGLVDIFIGFKETEMSKRVMSELEYLLAGIAASRDNQTVAQKQRPSLIFNSCIPFEVEINFLHQGSFS